MNQKLEFLVPPHSLKTARKLYSGSIEWEYFLREFPGQTSVKVNLHSLQNGTCLFCHKDIVKADAAEVHHLNYLHKCQMQTNIIRKGKSLCSFCQENFFHFFTSCMAKAALLHAKCHRKLHQFAMKREKNDKK